MIPLTHIPASESDSTALHLAHLRARGTVPWWGFGWIVVLAGLHAVFGFATTDVIGVCAGVAAWTGWTIWRRRYIRCARLLEPLLRDRWRPVDVALHGNRIVAGDAVYVLCGMPRHVRNVIARTGRVWLAGAARGYTAVRVDRSGRPWLARAGHWAGRVARPEPVVRGSHTKFHVVAGVASFFAAALLAVVAGTIAAPPEPGETGEAIFVYALVLVPLVILALWARRLRSKLPEPRAWRAVAGAVGDADFTEDDEPWVRAWAVLPEIGPVDVEIEDCPLDLYTAIWFHRRIWVQGEPRLGDVVIGMPEFPVTANATFRRRGLPVATRG
ncbi:hypothetical protein [Amycolatopsis sp. GM8]|uniref:hypothetical protein n=1 Tax=Amycolatopsis sp. GM8 TaxID=2896530 RepID=UPI001F208C7A|nr:hypothetical protein [Amycolatopsis sp. GM8]